MNKEKLDAMTDEELCVKAAQIIGLNIVHEEWPCGHPPESCGLEADQMPVLYNNEWITDSPDWYNRKYPVYLEPGLERYWPPRYNDEYDDWMTAVEPVPEYTRNWNDVSQLLDYMENIGLETIMVNCHDGNLKAVRVVRGVAAPFAPMGTLDNPTYFRLNDAIANVQDEKMTRAITKAFIMAMENE